MGPKDRLDPIEPMAGRSIVGWSARRIGFLDRACSIVPRAIPPRRSSSSRVSVLFATLFSFFIIYLFFFFLSCYERNFGERATSRHALRGIRITKIIGESGDGGQGAGRQWRVRCAVTMRYTNKKTTRGSSRAQQSRLVHRPRQSSKCLPRLPPLLPPQGRCPRRDGVLHQDVHPCCPFIAG